MKTLTGTDYLAKYGKAATEKALVEQLDFSSADLADGQYVKCLISDDGTEYTSFITDGNTDYGTIENFGDVSLENEVELEEVIWKE